MSRMATENAKSIVVYDGQCAFCRRRVEWIRRRDRESVFEFVPSGAADLLSRYPMLAGRDLNGAMQLITPDGRVSEAADAVYEIARRLRGWRRVAWLYRIPGLTRFWRWLYRWIARNRYSLARRCDETCAVSPADSRRNR